MSHSCFEFQDATKTRNSVKNKNLQEAVTRNASETDAHTVYIILSPIP